MIAPRDLWTYPIRRMPFESGGFISSLNSGALQRKYWAELDRADAARADAVQVCNCGAATVHDVHAADCWARPLPVMPFEQRGFTVTKPLPWKRFANGDFGLPLTNALFKARATRKEMYK
jgi:hypothetical protein